MVASVKRRAGSQASLALVFALAPACGGAAQEPRSQPVSGEAPQADEAGGDPDASKTPWETCYSSFSPGGSARDDLTRLVRDCGATGGMKPVTAIRTGEQAESDPVDRYTFEVPAAGRCYRVYAAGDSSVGDLDVLLRGPSGDAAIGDITHDSWPVVPPREPACFSQPGLYMLEVSVYRGSGKYALQVWGR
jgi:hypothetical protein